MYQLVSRVVRRLTKPILFGIMIMSVPMAALAADVKPIVNPSLNGSVKDINKSVVAPTALKPGTAVKPVNSKNSGAAADAVPCICDNLAHTCVPKGCYYDRKPDAATMKQPTQTMTMPRH